MTLESEKEEKKMNLPIARASIRPPDDSSNNIAFPILWSEPVL